MPIYKNIKYTDITNTKNKIIGKIPIEKIIF